MPSPPARTEISDDFPNPSNAEARIGFGKLWDYVTGLLGMTGDAEQARAALDVPSTAQAQNMVDAKVAPGARNTFGLAAHPTAADCNAPTSHWHVCNSSTANRPDPVSSGDNYILHTIANTGATLTPGSGVWLVQTAYAVSAARVFTRRNINGGGWTSWAAYFIPGTPI